MKLDIKNDEEVELLMLEAGECFKLHDDYYMKIQPVKTRNPTYTAVNLCNGQLLIINELTKVVPMYLVCVKDS